MLKKEISPNWEQCENDEKAKLIRRRISWEGKLWKGPNWEKGQIEKKRPNWEKFQIDINVKLT